MRVAAARHSNGGISSHGRSQCRLRHQQSCTGGAQLAAAGATPVARCSACPSNLPAARISVSGRLGSVDRAVGRGAQAGSRGLSHADDATRGAPPRAFGRRRGAVAGPSQGVRRRPAQSAAPVAQVGNSHCQDSSRGSTGAALVGGVVCGRYALRVYLPAPGPAAWSGKGAPWSRAPIPPSSGAPFETLHVTMHRPSVRCGHPGRLFGRLLVAGRDTPSAAGAMAPWRQATWRPDQRRFQAGFTVIERKIANEGESTD